MIEILREKAALLRHDIIDMIYNSDISSGHFGGSLSACEIIAALYWSEMKVDPNNPAWEDRDRFILGKGHSVPVVYAALAHKGYFDCAELRTYREKDSRLQGHPDCRKTPGLDASSGSLGQGLSVALGTALGLRQQMKQSRVYVLLSDGELQEGMVWEAAMAAAHYRVSNLVALVDRNGLQVDGSTESVMSLGNLEDKFRSFGWSVQKVDGHNVEEIVDALQNARKVSDKPSVIICATVKGKGVSFMENKIEWHCCNMNCDQFDSAMKDLLCKESD